MDRGVRGRSDAWRQTDPDPSDQSSVGSSSSDSSAPRPVHRCCRVSGIMAMLTFAGLGSVWEPGAGEALLVGQEEVGR